MLLAQHFNTKQGGFKMRKIAKYKNRIKIELTNSFHGTSCFVLAKHDGALSKKQVKSVWYKLCGSPHCTCGDVAGCRPRQVEQINNDGDCRVIF